MKQQDSIETRLQEVEARFEARFERLETLMVNLSQKLDVAPVAPPTESTAALRDWVTDYVSMRLQQLVPHTCEHVEQVEDAAGPYMEGTDVPCTEEVVHRVGRIPIPFVREMVVQRVAERAREAKIARVDVEFFEKAATF